MMITTDSLLKIRDYVHREMCSLYTSEDYWEAHTFQLEEAIKFDRELEAYKLVLDALDKATM